jgi:hypothetical protein
MLHLAIGYLRSYGEVVIAAGLVVVFLIQLLTIMRSRKAAASLRRRLRGIEATLDRMEGEQSARFSRAATNRSFETDIPQATKEKPPT